MPDHQKIRVLIVDDIAETRENIRRSLQFDNQIEVIGDASNGEEAIQLAKQLIPDVIIMDINMPDMDGITVTEMIRDLVPEAQVVMLSVQGDPNYMRRAMLVGARDFLTKPPSIDDLTAAIHRAGKYSIEFREKVEREKEQHAALSSASQNITEDSGSIIVVYSPKGGVGCTTIATNLAITLNDDHNNVILVDGNPQYGDVAVFLNTQARNYLHDITPRVDDLDKDVVLNVVSTHTKTGLHIIASPPNIDYAEQVTGKQFGKLLDYLRNMYEYVVVDTTSYLSDVVLEALTHADILVLVTSQDIPSIKNLSMFLSLADASGLVRDQILLIMNRFDKRIGITPERIGENLKQEVVLNIAEDERLLVTGSINKGVPIVIDNKNHPLSRSMSDLAKRVSGRISERKNPGE